MIILSNLKDNTRVDIVTKGNNVYRGWWVYSAKCGYFTQSQNTMLDGIIYAESIESVKVYKKGEEQELIKKFNFDFAWKAVKYFEEGNNLYTKEGEGAYSKIDNAPDVLRYFYRLYVEASNNE